jgi:hypothetical protein
MNLVCAEFDKSVIKYMRWLGGMNVAERNSQFNITSNLNRRDYLNWIFSMDIQTRTKVLGYEVRLNTTTPNIVTSHISNSLDQNNNQHIISYRTWLAALPKASRDRRVAAIKEAAEKDFLIWVYSLSDEHASYVLGYPVVINNI